MIYLKTPLNDQTYDQFWLSHQGKFPYIARVARMVLTPPTQVSHLKECFRQLQIKYELGVID